MDKRQHPLPSAAAGLAIALVVVLGACGLKPSQAPNLRVGVPSQPKQQAGTLGSPTTTLRVSVGNAVSIVPTRPAKSPVTADLGGDTPFNNDIAVDEPEVTASEPTAASSTSDAATTLPGSTTSSTPVTATVTATSTTIVANTTTPTAATSTSTATTSTSVAAGSRF